MNTNCLATLRTCPPCLFVSDELPYAKLPDVLEIINHAHIILCSIALIQVIQPSTRKGITTETILDSTMHDLLTGLDPARDAGF